MPEPPKQPQPSKQSSSTNDRTLISVSGGIAALLIEKTIRNGKGSEIPSLGIKLEKKDE